MKLYEVMNTSAKWEWTDTSEEAAAKFEVRGNEYEVLFDVQTNPIDHKRGGVIEASFALTTAPHVTKHDATSLHDALPILTTVVDIIKAYISAHNPTVLAFRATGNSRIRVYDRIGQRVFDQSWKKETTDTAANQKSWTFTKKSVSESTDFTNERIKTTPVKLYEVLDKPLPVKWVDPTIAMFEIGTGTYQVNFIQSGLSGDFTPEQLGDIDTKHGYTEITFNRFDHGSRKTSFEVTNTGDTFVVFATIMSAVKKYLSQHTPSLIGFDAKESSRVKLYTRFAKGAQSLGYETVYEGRTSKTRYSWLFKKIDDHLVGESTDFTKEQTKHPKLKLAKFLDKKNWGSTVKTKTTDTLVRDSKTKSIYGRRQIVQRDI